MFQLEFIPEEIWDKNIFYFKNLKIRWIQELEDVEEFCYDEGIYLFKEKF